MSMLSFSDDDDDFSLEALEALTLFRKAIVRCRAPPSVHHEIPVPDPLNPSLPHVIEGDSTPVLLSKKPFSLTRARMSLFGPPSVPLDVPKVPDPLAAFMAGTSTSRNAPLPSVSMQQQVEHSEQKMQCSAGCSDDIKTRPDQPDISENENVFGKNFTVRTDKIHDALDSKSLGGKRHQSLNDLERLELARMKKKARHMELVEREKIYLILKAQQDLTESRRNRLVQVIEASSGDAEQVVEDCLHVRRLRQLSSEKLQCAQVSVSGGTGDAVALTENSATVMVSVKGTDYLSRKSKCILGFLTVNFQAVSTDICSMSLFWITPESNQSKMSPSINTPSET